MKVKIEREVAQSCPTLRDPMNCSPPGSSVHGIFQAKVLEWVAIAFSEHKRYNVNQLKSIGFKMIQVNLNPQSISQQTHPEVARQLQGTK